MVEKKQYPKGIPYRAPRPHGDALLGGLAGAGLVALLSGGLGAALVGGLAGSALANQPLSLEAAIRAYLAEKGLAVIGFYRYGPQKVKVSFRYAPDKYWMIASSAPPSPHWTQEDIDDWLYGDLIDKQLPAAWAKISAHLNP